MDPALARRIRRHYDLLAPLYRRYWGEHIHHGYWDEPSAPRDPRAAQERLIEVLADAARIPRRARVLDVGCGFGGCARWLADHRDARVLGWTLSRTQARAAARSRRREISQPHGSQRQGAVLCAQADAATWPTRAGAFDVVWIVECLEHLHDKPGAFSAAARSLRAGGALALCAWMAHPEARDGLPQEVARAFLCPALATPGEHALWAEAAGLRAEVERDLTPHVRPTWDHVRRTARKAWARAAVAFLDRDTRRFVRGFELIARAYEQGHLTYRLLVARRP